MNTAAVLISVSMLVCCIPRCRGALIQDLIVAAKDAVAGQPLFLRKQRWPFDPLEGKRRNPEFEALHGHHSVLLTERLGLGEDGRQEERRWQQARRDYSVPITGRRFGIQ